MTAAVPIGVSEAGAARPLPTLVSPSSAPSSEAGFLCPDPMIGVRARPVDVWDLAVIRASLESADRMLADLVYSPTERVADVEASIMGARQAIETARTEIEALSTLAKRAAILRRKRLLAIRGRR